MMTIYDLHVLKDYIDDCDLCELKEGRINPVVDKGNPGSRIFICGMVPAKEENEQGLPFVGRAGKLLDKILEDTGLTLREVYITNLVKCFLAAGKSLKEEWIDACVPYLFAQIATIEPSVIITLGADASDRIIGDKFNKITKDRGNVYKMNDSMVIIPTFHPSYVLRKGGAKSTEYQHVLNDFREAKRLVYGFGQA